MISGGVLHRRRLGGSCGRNPTAAVGGRVHVNSETCWAIVPGYALFDTPHSIPCVNLKRAQGRGTRSIGLESLACCRCGEVKCNCGIAMHGGPSEETIAAVNGHSCELREPHAGGGAVTWRLVDKLHDVRHRQLQLTKRGACGLVVVD